MSRVMKDSGIPWIGEIPKDWEPMRFKNFISLRTKPSSGDNKIGLENIESESGRFVETGSKFEGNGVGFEKGDIVYGKLRPYLRKVWLATFRGNAVGDFYVFSSKSNSDCQYVKWLLLSDGFTKEVIGSTYGTKMPRVASEFILTLPYALPPLLEQQRIAEFLDRKCGEIDEAIALQEEFIEELKAYKQSVITEAVTRGLNPNVKFKDSGIDWIGQIPQGWDVRAIKTLAILKSGTNITTNEIADDGEGYPVYGGNGLRGYYSEYSNDGEFALIGRQGALCGNVNYGYGRFWATDHCVVCYPREEYVLRWFGETLRAMNLNQYSLSSAQPGLSVERIKDKYMPVPPLTEQQQIADYLDNKCAEIDSLIAIKQQKIEELKDYKKSIIYEYVTGKKEVK